ncbi:MAG: hypothetical protein AAF514_06750 [Verrucomicrobiota bacterium]
MKPSIITKLSLITFAAMLTIHSTTEARDYYVSAAKGKGKKATKEKPAKDMGNIISRLVPGDRVHIAGGTYLGRGANGSDIIGRRRWREASRLRSLGFPARWPRAVYGCVPNPRAGSSRRIGRRPLALHFGAEAQRHDVA